MSTFWVIGTQSGGSEMSKRIQNGNEQILPCPIWKCSVLAIAMEI